MSKRKTRKFNHHKITMMQIEAIEREYYKKLNGEMPKWQADMYA
jgi:hypothetical protein